MTNQITFTELKQKLTPSIIKKMCELTEGFELVDSNDKKYKQLRFDNCNHYLYHSSVFPLLLHRCVEGWNNQNVCKPIQILCNCVSFITDEDDPACINYGYDDNQYLPCHLTACEMAILDCLSEVLR